MSGLLRILAGSGSAMAEKSLENRNEEIKAMREANLLRIQQQGKIAIQSQADNAADIRNNKTIAQKDKEFTAGNTIAQGKLNLDAQSNYYDKDGKMYPGLTAQKASEIGGLMSEEIYKKKIGATNKTDDGVGAYEKDMKYMRAIIGDKKFAPGKFQTKNKPTPAQMAQINRATGKNYVVLDSTEKKSFLGMDRAWPDKNSWTLVEQSQVVTDDPKTKVSANAKNQSFDSLFNQVQNKKGDSKAKTPINEKLSLKNTQQPTGDTNGKGLFPSIQVDSHLMNKIGGEALPTPITENKNILPGSFDKSLGLLYKQTPQPAQQVAPADQRIQPMKFSVNAEPKKDYSGLVTNNQGQKNNNTKTPVASNVENMKKELLKPENSNQLGVLAKVIDEKLKKGEQLTEKEKIAYEAIKLIVADRQNAPSIITG